VRSPRPGRCRPRGVRARHAGTAGAQAVVLGFSHIVPHFHRRRRYHADLRGVLIAFARARFEPIGPYASAQAGGGAAFRIVDELPFLAARLRAEVLLFRPRVGQVLRGTVQSVGPGHVACLVAGIFNATILKDDMGEGYEFDDAGSGGGCWVGADARATAVLAVTRGGDSGSADSSAPAAAAAAGRKRKHASSSSSSAPTFNRILACSPETLAPGAVVAFRVAAVSHSSEAQVALHGSFVDDHGKLAPTLPPKDPPAPVPIRRSDGGGRGRGRGGGGGGG
jgi:hypothetical protein